jgi:methionyl-tRNA formyltransferase
MDPGVDTGPILSQRALPIEPDDTAGSLSPRLAALGAGLLLETLPLYLKRQLRPQPQSGEATLAPLLKKEDGKLDFTKPAEELSRQVRAFNPWPGSFIEWEDRVFKILRAHPEQVEFKNPSGTRISFGNAPAIVTGNGILVLDEVQPSGRKPMPGSAFLTGARDWLG